MYENKFPSIYRGVVESNKDPEGLGRCKIRVPAIHGELNYAIDMLPWARPIVLSPIKSKRGSVNLPDTGDIVWVFFEGSNREFPVYLGGTYGKGEVGVDNDNVKFYLENDTVLNYSRYSRSYDINIGDKHIVMNPQGIVVKGDVVIEGNLRVSKMISADMDVYGGGTSLNTHLHGGVESGPSFTRKPTSIGSTLNLKIPSITLNIPGLASSPVINLPTMSLINVSNISNLNLPTTPNMNLQTLGLNINLPEISGLDLSSLSGVDIPEIDVLDIAGIKVDIPNIKVDIPNIPNVSDILKIPDSQISDIADINLNIPNIGLKIPSLPDIQLPGSADIKLPEIDIKIPDVNIKIPTIPDIKIPDIDISDIKIPDINIPKIEIPNIDISEIKIPPVSVDLPELPTIDIPGVNIPNIPDIDLSDKVGIQLPDIDTSTDIDISLSDIIEKIKKESISL